MLYIGFWFTNLIWDISSEMRGFFPPPLLPPTSSCTDLACWSGACRHCQLQDTHVCPRVWCMLSPAAYMCTWRYVGRCRLWVEGTVWSLLYQCDFPHFNLKIWGRELIRRPQGCVASLISGPLGSCLRGLFSPGPRLASWVTGTEKESESVSNEN